MPDFGIMRGFNEKLFGDKLVAGQLPINLGLIGSQDVSLLLLDLYPNAAAAYSVRKLRTAYTGSAIRVRRSSDNTEQNIGFVNNVLDTSSLTSFCGSGNGFVTTWYDQIGTNNLRQTTAANQPQIVSGGTIITIAGTGSAKPTFTFDGVNDYFSTASALNINNGPITLITLSYTTLSAGYYFIAGGADFATASGYQYASALIPNKYYFEIKSAGSASDVQQTKTANYALQTGIVESGTQYLYVNNSLAASRSISLSFATTTIPLYVGTPSTLGSYFSGNINEIIIYPSGQVSNVSGINNNINAYYGIY